MTHFILHSRAHPLSHFPTRNCFVKREDELSFGISGSKYRKYASLIPYLMKENVKHLVVIASPYSNNLLAALQMAAEAGLSVTPFLLKPHNLAPTGNYLYSALFLKEQNIHWFCREDWRDVNDRAEAFSKAQKEIGRAHV